MFKNISENRYEFLSWAWGEESDDPETQEWREELTPEEQAVVASWDKAFNDGVKSLCHQILNHECVIATKPYDPFLEV